MLQIKARFAYHFSEGETDVKTIRSKLIRTIN